MIKCIENSFVISYSFALSSKLFCFSISAGDSLRYKDTKLVKNSDLIEFLQKLILKKIEKSNRKKEKHLEKA